MDLERSKPSRPFVPTRFFVRASVLWYGLFLSILVYRRTRLHNNDGKCLNFVIQTLFSVDYDLFHWTQFFVIR